MTEDVSEQDRTQATNVGELCEQYADECSPEAMTAMIKIGHNTRSVEAVNAIREIGDLYEGEAYSVIIADAILSMPRRSSGRHAYGPAVIRTCEFFKDETVRDIVNSTEGDVQKHVASELRFEARFYKEDKPEVYNGVLATYQIALRDNPEARSSLLELGKSLEDLDSSQARSALMRYDRLEKERR